MRKARFTEHQIIAALESVEAGRTVKDVCREAGISEASYYNWKAKYGGMEASDIKKIKELEDENRRLKQMFADLSLENRALKDVSEKNSEASSKTRAGQLHGADICTQHQTGLPAVITEQSGARICCVMSLLSLPFIRRQNAIHVTDSASCFRSFAGRATPGIINACTVFTACLRFFLSQRVSTTFCLWHGIRK